MQNLGGRRGDCRSSADFGTYEKCACNLAVVLTLSQLLPQVVLVLSLGTREYNKLDPPCKRPSLGGYIPLADLTRLTRSRQGPFTSGSVSFTSCGAHRIR